MQVRLLTGHRSDTLPLSSCNSGKRISILVGTPSSMHYINAVGLQRQTAICTNLGWSSSAALTILRIDDPFELRKVCQAGILECREFLDCCQLSFLRLHTPTTDHMSKIQASRHCKLTLSYLEGQLCVTNSFKHLC